MHIRPSSLPALVLILLCSRAFAYQSILGPLSDAVAAHLKSEPANPDKTAKKEIAALNRAAKSLAATPADISADMSNFLQADSLLLLVFPTDSQLNGLSSTLLKSFTVNVKRDLYYAKAFAARIDNAKYAAALKTSGDKASALMNTPTTNDFGKTIKKLLGVEKLIAGINKTIDKANGPSMGPPEAKAFISADVGGTAYNKSTDFNEGVTTTTVSSGDSRFYCRSLFNLPPYQGPVYKEYPYMEIDIGIFNGAIGDFNFTGLTQPPGDRRVTQVDAYLAYHHGTFDVDFYAANSGVLYITNIDFLRGTIEATFTFNAHYAGHFPDNTVPARPDISVSSGVLLDTLGTILPFDPNN